jgi:hypothetical protein
LLWRVPITARILINTRMITMYIERITRFVSDVLLRRRIPRRTPVSEKESGPGQHGGYYQREDEDVDDQFDPQGFHWAIHLTVLLYPTSSRMSMIKR